ncbi:MAG: recombination protein RecR, partial [Pseudomonadota bacterium]
RVLPGVGPRSALRMATQLLVHDRVGAEYLSQSLQRALSALDQCRECQTLCEEEVCGICQSQKRDARLLCVVETPSDLLRVEQAGAFTGKYYVLMGRLSPLDGVGTQELKFAELMKRACDGVVQEVVVATNFTAEGEATAHVLDSLLTPRGLKVTRLARGVPVGGEIEFVDGLTLAQAFRERRDL